MQTANLPGFVREHRQLLWATALGSFLPPFLGSALNVALPVIGQELQATAFELGLIVNAFLIAAAGMLVPLGRWADACGRARVFSWGLLVQALCSAAGIFARSVPALLLVRAAQGVAAAATFATAVALVAQVAPAGQKGKLLGANTAAVYLGLTLGPPTGGLLTQHLGWRSVFATSALLALAGWALASPWGTEKSPREAVSHPGTLWLFAAGVALVLGGLAMSRMQWRFAALAAVGVIAVLLSFRVSSNVPLEAALFRNTAFTFSNLAAFIHYAATFSVSLFLALYLQVVGGLSPKATGFLLLAQPLLMALLSPVAGSVSDRWEPRWVASAGMALTAGGLLVLSFAQARVSLFQVISGLALLGVGFALFSSPNTHAVMGQAPSRLLSAASATLALMRLTGQAGSLVLASFFLPATNLHTQAGKLLVPGMQANLWVASLLCLLGMAFSLARGNVHG